MMTTTTTLEMKTKKSKFNAHIAKQYKRMISSKNNKSEANAWPLDFNQFVTKNNACPESWSVLSVNH